jgi:radical SAM-linked protein
MEDFTARLKAQLPPEMPIYQVEEVAVKSDSATKLLHRAEYLITVENLAQGITLNDWQNWLNLVNNSTEILLEKTTKSGKVNQVNLCDRLFSLTLDQVIDENKAILRYVGSCRNDGTLLTGDHVVYMLNKVSDMEFNLLHIHREKLILETD